MREQEKKWKRIYDLFNAETGEKFLNYWSFFKASIKSRL